MLVLLFLGARYLLARTTVIESFDPEPSSEKPIGPPFSDGFPTTVTNLDIAVFSLTLFSQFIRPNADSRGRIIIVATAGAIAKLYTGISIALLLALPKTQSNLMLSVASGPNIIVANKGRPYGHFARSCHFNLA